MYGINETSNWGVTGQLSAGKEWWVSSNWGLGIAGELFLGRMAGGSEPGRTETHPYTVKGFSLLVSASFN